MAHFVLSLILLVPVFEYLLLLGLLLAFPFWVLIAVISPSASFVGATRWFAPVFVHSSTCESATPSIDSFELACFLVSWTSKYAALMTHGDAGNSWSGTEKCCHVAIVVMQIVVVIEDMN